ncbi:MAG TPA: hypothetical protein VHW43_09770 [Puia sp.]|nr:hypothetical protein [Puia sp.]
MKRYKFLFCTGLLSVSLLFSSCYKYEKDISYAAVNGSMIDVFTNTTLDYGTITVLPAQLVNGSMVLDTSGHFTDMRMMPGMYTFHGAITNNASFTSDSATVTLTAGTTAPAVNLKVAPFVSILSNVTAVTDTTITISYTIQGNNGLLPSKQGIFYSLTAKPTVQSYTKNPLLITPAPGSENGKFSYTITGLTANTTYNIIVAALAGSGTVNPGNNYNQGREMIVTTAKTP